MIVSVRPTLVGLCIRQFQYPVSSALCCRFLLIIQTMDIEKRIATKNRFCCPAFTISHYSSVFQRESTGELSEDDRDDIASHFLSIAHRQMQTTANSIIYFHVESCNCSILDCIFLHYAVCHPNCMCLFCVSVVELHQWILLQPLHICTNSKGSMSLCEMLDQIKRSCKMHTNIRRIHFLWATRTSSQQHWQSWPW